MTLLFSKFSPFLQVVIIYEDDFLVIMNSIESALSLNAVRRVHGCTRWARLLIVSLVL